MEEQILRCNNRTGNGGICRQELKDSAIVTTCSHVLCPDCAQKTGFRGKPGKDRECPVCTQPLPNIDDAAETNLRPTEEYRISVLCGLDPTTIMECASSALSFWNYQMLQETAYQKHLLLALSKKYSGLSQGVDKMVKDANHEIDNLHKKIDDACQTNMDLQQKNLELVDTCRDRGRKYAELRKGYEILKKMAQQNKLNKLNEEVAERTVQSFTMDPELGILEGVVKGRSSKDGNDHAGPYDLHNMPMPIDHRGVEQVHPSQRAGSGSRYSGDASMMPPPHRPSYGTGVSPLNIHPQNRTPLGLSRATANRSQNPANTDRGSTHHSFVSPGSGPHHSARVTAPHSTIHGRHHSTGSCGGISAGMKVGNASVDAQQRRNTGYIPLRNLQQRHNDSHPTTSQHFWR